MYTTVPNFDETPGNSLNWYKKESFCTLNKKLIILGYI